jgi:hypothetical protein
MPKTVRLTKICKVCNDNLHVGDIGVIDYDENTGEMVFTTSNITTELCPSDTHYENLNISIAEYAKILQTTNKEV